MPVTDLACTVVMATDLACTVVMVCSRFSSLQIFSRTSWGYGLLPGVYGQMEREGKGKARLEGEQGQVGGTCICLSFSFWAAW